MNIERDKFLTESIGECWHDFIVDNSSIEWDERTTCDEADATCSKCGEHCKAWREDRTGWAVFGDKHLVWQFPIYIYNNFSTPDGFFKLWDWTTTQNWWFIFRRSIDLDYRVHPDRFADAVYEFLKEKNNDQVY